MSVPSSCCCVKLLPGELLADFFDVNVAADAHFLQAVAGRAQERLAVQVVVDDGVAVLLEGLAQTTHLLRHLLGRPFACCRRCPLRVC
jgi:hypothetical protein